MTFIAERAQQEVSESLQSDCEIEPATGLRQSDEQPHTQRKLCDCPA